MKIVRSGSRRGIQYAASAIKSGGVVVFPTETVYGMGADAFNPAACRRIFRIKGRPSANPLIVHVSSRVWVGRLARDIPCAASVLMKRFWPGPLTLVLKKRKEVSPAVTGGLDTVAVRMPSSRAALDFIKAAGTPIAAPSANVSGRVSPVAHADVVDDFSARPKLGPSPDVLIAGGRSRRGMESTIVDLSKSRPAILRHGSITAEAVAGALGIPTEELLRRRPAAGAVEAPGMLKAHYRPRIPLVVFSTAAAMKKNLLAGRFPYPPKAVFVISPSKMTAVFRRAGFSAAGFDGPSTLARNLYYLLRKAAKSRAGVIAAPLLAGDGLARAVNDRLRRAASEIVRG